MSLCEGLGEGGRVIKITVQRKGNAYYPVSDEDRDEGLMYPENKLLQAKISGTRKARSLLELHCFWGSCRYIASLNLNEDMNTKEKVNYLTRIKAGFVEDTVYDDVHKRVHWIPKRLNYESCNQPTAHRFIATALEMHAELAGVKNVDEYVRFLNELGDK